MGLARMFAGPLLVSAWLLTHALFMVLCEPYLQKDRNGVSDIQQMIPIRLPSLFQLSWFHKLVRQTFNCDLLAMPRGVCGESCVRVFSWIISALTLAEWAFITMLVVRALWNNIIRPAIQTIGMVLLILAIYSCFRSCAFMLAAHLPDDVAVGVVRLLVAIDFVVDNIWSCVGGIFSWALWALDGVLSSLVWPSLEAIKDDATHPNHRSLLGEVLKKTQEVATHLPDGGHAEF